MIPGGLKLFGEVLGFYGMDSGYFYKDKIRKMNAYEFGTIGYFISHYFNCSMDYSDLENCIDDFLLKENITIIKAFKKEIEILYMLNSPEIFREVSYNLGSRGMPTDKALDIMKLLYTKTQNQILAVYHGRTAKETNEEKRHGN